MIGICRHLREPALTQKPLDTDANSIHRESRAFGDDTKAHRIRSHVLIAAEFNKVEDVLGIGKLLCRLAIATLARSFSGLPVSVLRLG
jgi:hypothetical protein